MVVVDQAICNWHWLWAIFALLQELLIVSIDADLADLIYSSSPLEWATENLKQVGYGTAATIFEHPVDPDLIIRISDYPDGWFMYADETLRIEEEDGGIKTYRPKVHWIGNREHTWIAASERLEPIEAESRLALVADAVIRALLNGGDDDWIAVEDIAPGFREFCAGLNARLDLRDTNFMRRGETLIFNDPYSAIPFGLEPFLRDRYSILGTPSARQSPKP